MEYLPKLFEKNKKHFAYLSSYILTAIILYLLLQHVGIENIAHVIKESDPIYIGCAFILSVIFVIISGIRLKFLVNLMDQDISVSRCIKLVFATYPINIFIPSKGGDFIKSWSLRDMLPLSHGIGVVILERFIDLIILCIMTVVCSILINHLQIFTIALSTILVGNIALYILFKLSYRGFKNNAIISKILVVTVPLKYFMHNRKYSYGICIISIIIWFGTILQVYLLYFAVGEKVPILYVFTAVPIAIFVGFFPITVAGMGTRDLTLVYLFSAYADPTSSLTVGLYLSLLRYWVLAIIGLPFIKNLYTKS